MTRLVRKTRKTAPGAKSRAWPLQDAKARFSEVVRRACDTGPQHITVHGKDTVVVISADDFAKLTIHVKYPTLRSLFENSPLSDVEFGRESFYPPVRPVEDL